MYTLNEYDRHMREGNPDGSDGQGHPECAFCQVRYYDKTELYKHVTKSHQTCHLCSRDGTQYKYYRDYKMLEDHFRKEHFACDEFECVEKKNIVFKSLFDLQAHKRSVHSQASAAVLSEGQMGGDWDFPSLQGSSGIGSGQTHAQSIAASIRRGSGASSGKVPDTFSSSPEAFPSLGSTRRPVIDNNINIPVPVPISIPIPAPISIPIPIPVMTPLAPAPVVVVSKAPPVSQAAPTPVPTPTPPTPSINTAHTSSSRGYDDMDSGFDYSLASLSLNATAAPYSPANPSPLPLKIGLGLPLPLVPVPALSEYQPDFGPPRIPLGSGHQSMFGDMSSIGHPHTSSHTLNDSRQLPPIRQQSPSIGDLTSMLSGITSQPHTERSGSFSLTNQFSQSSSSALNINDFFSHNSSSRGGLDFGGGLSNAFSSSPFSGIIGGREEGQMFNMPFTDLSGFGTIGGRNTSRLPLSLLHDDDDDEGDFSKHFQMAMLTEDDEDEKVEVSLGAYRSGQLTYERVSDLCRQACDDYGLDSVCRSYFYDSPIEMVCTHKMLCSFVCVFFYWRHLFENMTCSLYLFLPIVTLTPSPLPTLLPLLHSK